MVLINQCVPVDPHYSSVVDTEDERNEAVLPPRNQVITVQCF